MQKDESETPAAAAIVEVLEAVVSVLLKESEELKAKTKKKSNRPKKVKID